MTASRVPPTLLATKLFVPRARADLVARPGLVERLEHGLKGRLTLIAAPAGFGKTTLVCAWHASGGRHRMPLGWVSLDATDNDPLRFWSYVLTALDRVAPGIGAPALTALGSAQPPPIDSVLSSVLDALEADGTGSGDIALVLDDYHVITTSAIHAALARMVDFLPVRLHLVILTRTDPPLPLARLRAGGTLTELRAHDLRFTGDEIPALFERVAGEVLSPDAATALATRTEGWAAGLQLAALALRGRDDPDEFIRTFSGSNRYVVDYLLAEVLAHQSTEHQEFLLRTSILDRLCGALSDALLDRDDDDAGVHGRSQDTLVALERANLFLVPLDDERQWYRYHHLFRDVLRQRLTQSVPAGRILGLHIRASTWYEDRGLLVEAVRHSLDGQDWTRAARLIERDGVRLIVGGQMRTVLAWLDRMPEAQLRSRPQLCIAGALARLFLNDLPGARSRLADAEHCIGPATPRPDADRIRGLAAAIRANICLYTGDIAGCVSWGGQVLELLPEDDSIARTTAGLHVAKAFRYTGDVTEAAEQRAIAAIAPVRATGNVLGTISALANLARLQRLQGRLRSAATTYHELVQPGTGSEAPRDLHGGLAYYVGLGEVHREWADLATAEGYLSEATTLIPGLLTADAEDVLQGYLSMADLQRARGHDADARAALDTLEDEAHRRGFVAHLARRVAAERARHALATGDRLAATDWARASGLAMDDAVDFPHEAEYLILARIAIARADRRDGRAQLPPVIRLLDRLLADALAKERRSSVIEILVLRAMASHARLESADAVEMVARAVAIAEPEGYVRRFADEGVVLEAVLRAARMRGVAPAYIDRLLRAFPVDTTDARTPRHPDHRPHARTDVPSDGPDPETLSSRELTVLRLMSSGRSNTEIARDLVVAVSTVKSHVNAIFGKLQVTNRGDAIARARDLGLL